MKLFFKGGYEFDVDKAIVAFGQGKVVITWIDEDEAPAPYHLAKDSWTLPLDLIERVVL